MNGDIKGMGKKLIESVIEKSKEHGYKYVFLYPSKSLGGTGNQDNLIKYYISLGFIKLESCVIDDGEGVIAGINTFDGNAPYHLMFAKIDSLKLDSSMTVKLNYFKKYLKYKSKYLELQKNLLGSRI